MVAVHPADVDARLRLCRVLEGGSPRGGGPRGFGERPVVAAEPSIAEPGPDMDGGYLGPCPRPRVGNLFRRPRVDLFDPGFRRGRPRLPGARCADRGVS